VFLVSATLGLDLGQEMPRSGLNGEFPNLEPA
jgi:hypothetical protein